MQTVSLKIAKGLKAAGLNWGILRQGDFYWDDGTVNCWAESHQPLAQQLRPSVHALWLPRLDQVMAEIERRVEVVEIIFTNEACLVLIAEWIDDNMGGLVSYEGEDPDNTEAAGLALVKIMEAQNAS